MGRPPFDPLLVLPIFSASLFFLYKEADFVFIWEGVINLQKLECGGLCPILYLELGEIETHVFQHSKATFSHNFYSPKTGSKAIMN